MRELAEEPREGWRGRELALPIECVARKARRVAIRRHYVDVTGMEWRYGDSSAPENKVLGVLAHLTKGKYVALSNLVEAMGSRLYQRAFHEV
jgi:hypothetical protein